MKEKFLSMQKIESRLENFQEIDKNFATASLKVMYLGKNPNGTFFSKDAVEKNMHTLINMPIVGEFDSETRDFKGHGGEVIIDEDDNMHLRPTTRPYGVVPESFEYEWIMDDIGDDRQKETLVIHGIILWTKHYEEAANILLNQSSHSMEISVDDGSWNEEYEVFDVTNFSFHALCVLGDKVQPAFSNSHFYSEIKEFKEEFAQMLSEYSSIVPKKEDKQLMTEEEKLELFKKKKKEDEEEAKKKAKAQKDKKDIEEDDPSEDDPEKKEPKDKEDDPKKDKETDKKDQPKDKEPSKNEPKDDKPKDSDPEKLKTEIEDLKEKLKEKEEELKKLRSFQQGVLSAQHEAAFDNLMKKYRLEEADIEVDDIHAFSLDQLEEKMLMAVGRKAVNGKFSLDEPLEEKLPKNKVDLSKTSKIGSSRYGELFEKFSVDKEKY